MVWQGSNNIEDGVTIDLGNMNSITYNHETSIARILPGAQWLSVYQALDAFGVNVPGGRYGHVGVGGLVTGGGNSFFSARTGMVCDSVLNFEVVLATGKIVNANNETNPDLFKALKGGSLNFGIVTRFDMETFAAPRIWGGIHIYNNTKRDEHIDALVKFTENIENDSYSSASLFWSYRLPFKETVIFAAYEKTKGEEAGPSYEDFMKIEPIVSTQRLTNMSDLAAELDQPTGYRSIWFTLSFKKDGRMIKKVVDLHDELVT